MIYTCIGLNQTNKLVVLTVLFEYVYVLGRAMELLTTHDYAYVLGRAMELLTTHDW